MQPKKVNRTPLPIDKELFYDFESESFLYQYENGGLMVHGNHLNTAKIPIEDVVAYLANTTEVLRAEIRQLKDES